MSAAVAGQSATGNMWVADSTRLGERIKKKKDVLTIALSSRCDLIVHVLDLIFEPPRYLTWVSGIASSRQVGWNEILMLESLEFRKR